MFTRRMTVIVGHFGSGKTEIAVNGAPEVAKKNAIYFKGRGIDRRPALVPGMGDECGACMQCFNLCTGGWLVRERSRELASV